MVFNDFFRRAQFGNFQVLGIRKAHWLEPEFDGAVSLVSVNMRRLAAFLGLKIGCESFFAVNGWHTRKPTGREDFRKSVPSFNAAPAAAEMSRDQRGGQE